MDSREQWMAKLKEEFSKESDRAIVIISAAMIDLALEHLLKAKFVAISTSEDPLFDAPNAPLSNFSSRIDIAYRTGLISTKFARDLHLIRRIRNEFAHNLTDCNFNSASVQSRVSSLNRSITISKTIPEIKNQYNEGTRREYQICVAWLLWYLVTLTNATTTLETANEEWGYMSKEEADRLFGSEKTA